MATSGKWVAIGMVTTAVVTAALLGPERASRIRELARVETDIHQLRGEGLAFGEGRDPDACMTEALQRGAAACPPGDLPCTARAGLFLEGCLNAVVLPLSYCADAPRPDPVSKAESGTTDAWLRSACAERGFPDSVNCTRVLHEGLLRACATARADAGSEDDPTGGVEHF